MEQVVIACKTLEDELDLAMERTGSKMQVHWIESGLHNFPKKLNERLQDELEAIDGAERVLMCFGSCGNSLIGLEAGGFEMVIPRVDDCISLLIGSNERREMISQEYAAYYLTEGWLRGERNIWVEHQYAVEKFGEEQAREIDEMLFSKYRTLALIDTGAYPFDSLLEETGVIADTLGLEQKKVSGSTSFIESLLTGPYDPSRFVVVPEHGTVEAEMFLAGRMQ